MAVEIVKSLLERLRKTQNGSIINTSLEVLLILRRKRTLEEPKLKAKMRELMNELYINKIGEENLSSPILLMS